MGTRASVGAGEFGIWRLAASLPNLADSGGNGGGSNLRNRGRPTGATAGCRPGAISAVIIYAQSTAIWMDRAFLMLMSILVAATCMASAAARRSDSGDARKYEDQRGDPLVRPNPGRSCRVLEDL